MDVVDANLLLQNLRCIMGSKVSVRESRGRLTVFKKKKSICQFICLVQNPDTNKLNNLWVQFYCMSRVISARQKTWIIGVGVRACVCHVQTIEKTDKWKKHRYSSVTVVKSRCSTMIICWTLSHQYNNWDVSCWFSLLQSLGSDERISAEGKHVRWTEKAKFMGGGLFAVGFVWQCIMTVLYHMLLWLFVLVSCKQLTWRHRLLIWNSNVINYCGFLYPAVFLSS